VPAGADARPRFILDAMVLAAGLTSRRERVSFSRRLVELALDRSIDLVLTDVLLDETRDVLVAPKFVGRVTEEEAMTLLAGLAAASLLIVHDRGLIPAGLTDDPDDDYLADAALKTASYLVTRDDRAGFGRVSGLESGRPGTALRRLGLLENEAR
jgi:predicted nucleic acid-binding protein